jgi:hypothetical protein
MRLLTTDVSEERPRIPPVGRAIASILKLVALLALGLYAVLLLKTLLQNPAGFYQAEVSALQNLVSGVAPTGPGPTGPGAPTGPAGGGASTTGLATIVICVVAIIFLWLLFTMWWETIQRQLRLLLRCRWVGFWGWLGCLLQTILWVVELMVYSVLVFVALAIVAINILAVIAVIVV